MRRSRRLLLAILLLGAVAPRTSVAATARPAIALELVVDGLTKPVFVADAGDGSGRLFVVEKPGTIRIVLNRQRLEQPFLDLRSLVNAKGNEQGLLSVAFHPDYAHNGQLFVAYTDLAGDLVIARHLVSADDPDRVDASRVERLLTIAKPYDDHNGGLITFGPDGFLYIGVGDGGANAEIDANAQNPRSFLGKILRIDIDRRGAARPYAIPLDNPFVDDARFRPEIWALGLRNPWRFAFDHETGHLYIADVGLWMAEEVDVELAGDPGGHNYGWPIMEGHICHQPGDDGDCRAAEFTPPVVDYRHGQECAIVGGFVYRGSAVPALDGWFVVGDFCSGRIKGLRRDGDRWALQNLAKTPLLITSFGQDTAGELYVVDLAGGLYRVVARPAAPAR